MCWTPATAGGSDTARIESRRQCVQAERIRRGASVERRSQRERRLAEASPRSSRELNAAERPERRSGGDRRNRR